MGSARFWTPTPASSNVSVGIDAFLGGGGGAPLAATPPSKQQKNVVGEPPFMRIVRTFVCAALPWFEAVAEPSPSGPLLFA